MSALRVVVCSLVIAGLSLPASGEASARSPKDRPTVRRAAMEWVPMGPRSPLPRRAWDVSEGQARTPWYLCRANYRGSKYPGTLRKRDCVIAADGQAISFSAFEIFTKRRGLKTLWLAPQPNATPSGLSAGRAPGAPLYVCRSRHQGALVPGKLRGNRCRFAWRGKVVAKKAYEVLVSDRRGPVWVRAQGAALPVGAVDGGYGQTRELRICKASAGRRLKTGWINRNNACVIPSRGQIAMVTRYEELHVPYRWVTDPAGANLGGTHFPGGWEGKRKLFVCRARYRGGMHPGKVVAGRCNIGYGGREVALAGYQQLVASKGMVTWVRAARGAIPRGAVQGGQENRAPLYVCRANHAGGQHPGKIVGGGCNIGYGGQELVKRQYDVLVTTF